VISVLQNNIQYVAALCSAETQQLPNSEVVTVSSFLSSVYFPDDTLRRFFVNAKDGLQIAAMLIERKNCVKNRILYSPLYKRIEIYEVEAITRLIDQGRPHAQEREFHLLPTEIEDVLQTMLTLLGGGRSTEYFLHN
jgi:hypothetical protein